MTFFLQIKLATIRPRRDCQRAMWPTEAHDFESLLCSTKNRNIATAELKELKIVPRRFNGLRACPYFAVA